MVDDLDLDKDGTVEQYEIDAYLRKTHSQRMISYGSFVLITIITVWAMFIGDTESVIGKQDLLFNMVFVFMTLICANYGISAWQDKNGK